jgi:hypothetical protein
VDPPPPLHPQPERRLLQNFIAARGRGGSRDSEGMAPLAYSRYVLPRV